MHHELHAADFVEEPLYDERLLGRQNPQRGVTRSQIFDELLGRGFGNADLIPQPRKGIFAG